MTVAVSCLQSPKTERARLYRRFRPRLLTNPHLDRTLVSFQANRKLPYYRWLKYKEGFSAEFVAYVIAELAHSPGILLDPFAGTGTALYAARSMGWDTIGIELLPIGFFAAEARLAADTIDPKRFQREVEKVRSIKWSTHYSADHTLHHIPITEGAFPEKTERSIAGYRAYCARMEEANVRKLFDLAGISVLEAASYTRKDGQYLRWDQRSGRTRCSQSFNKGPIADFDAAVARKLSEISHDLLVRHNTQADLFGYTPESVKPGCVDLRRGSCLELLPKLENESVDIVITSPPYCNRYDYTRTYALELVYLGANADQIKTLRQQLLSCTVENKTKAAQLRALYESLHAGDVYDEVVHAFNNQKALQEAVRILETLGSRGKLNNSNVPTMVKNYFFEMAFVIYELARVVRRGGTVVMVNDNVRYAGEEIPVDLILSDFAESFGMETQHIWTLARGKGNSSQQMGMHGRSELRKCVYVWRKIG